MVSDATGTKDALVILKRHPDATIGNMGSYFSAGNLGPLLSHPSVIFHDEEINPYSLFDAVDEVWCVTSGMGFEALIAGKKVRAYGAPFYAGWGLTEDRLRLDWRNRRPRSIDEIFYCSYLARSVYFNERTGSKCSLSDLVSQVAIDRDQYLTKAS
jgi:capsule polysaccharide export protein KpsC/LpsZ